MPNENEIKCAKAKAMYVEGKGERTLKSIAEELGVPPSTIHNWKKRYQWEKEIPKGNRKPRLGNKNAKGNHRSPASPDGQKGNLKAYKSSLYASIKYAHMTEEERKLIGISTERDDPIEMQKCLIAELEIRESRMYGILASLQADNDGLVLDSKIVESRIRPGDSSSKPYKGTMQKTSATQRILDIENSLSIVQRQKQTAISALHSMERSAEAARIERQKLEMEKARLELQKRRTDWLDPSGESESAKRAKAQEQLISIAALINAEDKPERTIESIDAMETGE